jgi:hypothetical protein
MLYDNFRHNPFSRQCNQPGMPEPGFDRSLFIVILITITIGIAMVLGSTIAKPGW